MFAFQYTGFIFSSQL